MITKFRAYRHRIAATGVVPITSAEWLLGRLAGRLQVRTATMAKRRGDNASLNHALLALWAGNQCKGGHLAAAALEPAELACAIKDGRLRLVIDPYRSPQA
ncbi:hypothetical protein IV500_05770 [Paeniglutamicibacter antarcticus]|uniref:Uncharacterized protein n=1 Tax=Arthrobacter terrae TaxID=2935737 RepID=A0A931CM02_9MICC|nr:hypothetical protein [Arthrobacter terrae]MBG0738930.1 hypothetical protein [Arthrobacter terrae]